jgi:tRNA nucleotidyltransferase/poly(A) polymerase
MSLTAPIDITILQTLKKYIPSVEVYLVGGAVRDYFMSRKSKDRDYVIINATIHQISEAISSIGIVKEVGKSFGIVKAVIDGEEFDFAIPRTEVSTGTGHQDFLVVTGGVTLLEDLSRRDFTMNAIAYNIETETFIDPFDGVASIKGKYIKFCGTPLNRYTEDPLRLLRLIQFAHRFDMTMHLSDKLPLGLLSTVSKERVYEEYKKMFLKGTHVCKSHHIFKTVLGRNIHNELFGVNQYIPGDIEVIPVSELSEDDVVNTYLVAMFLYNGTYTNMCVTNDNADHIGMARRIHRITRGREQFDPIHFKNKVLVKSVRNIFRRFEMLSDVAKVAAHIFNTPTTIKELDITGDELISLGIVNQQIGILVREVSVKMYWETMENTNEAILEYINGSKEDDEV